MLLEAGVEGLEILHPEMTKEDMERAYKICIENNLYISGGSDHSGLCGGNYSSYVTEEELKKSCYYLKPLSVGVYERYFDKIKNKKISEGNREIF